MAYKINKDCVACGVCKDQCPVAAIADGDPHFVIDASLCIDCGACNGVCPTGAPQPE